ncbi:MAG: D-alanine--D-alanine ligase [Desulfobacteraceae bacterium]|nr:MAG: D-alanine--D-alanine ligase [Desulfobacteraceae bacterium]
MNKLRIALIAGGRSGEREVSLRSGEAVYEALDRKKYDVTRYDPRDDLIGLIRDKDRIDLAFILLHGRFGEDGCIQGFLQLLDIPFVGSGVLASAMAIHKSMSKELYRIAGLKVAEDAILTRGEPFSAETLISSLGNALVVKPISEGSSLGMSICRSPKELSRGIEEAFRHDSEIMIEKFIQGREFTCCVLGNSVLETLPIIEIIPNPEYPFFDYQAKYTPGATKEICPASISENEQKEMEFCAKEAHRVLKCSVWSRTDMILQDGNVYVLETNTIPGMTATSLVPLAARAAGMNMPALLDRLVEISLEGAGRQNY